MNKLLRYALVALAVVSFSGVVAAQKVGAMAKGQLTSFIDSNI